MNIKEKLWEILSPAGDHRYSKAFDVLIISLIAFGTVLLILDSVQDIHAQYGEYFAHIEMLLVLVFSLEYVMRLWACTVEDGYRSPILGRLKFALTPMSIIDLLAILPFYLTLVGLDSALFLRILRLFRLLRLLKLARYYRAFRIFKQVFQNCYEELILTLSIIGLLLVIASFLVYYFENPVQPHAFPDLPATLWWGIVTLSTIGYGDIFPITFMGRVITGIIAVMGIGMFALPAGILGSEFMEAIRQERQAKATQNAVEQPCCPHCGKTLQDHEV